jgi:hypothetical protein
MGQGRWNDIQNLSAGAVADRQKRLGIRVSCIQGFLPILFFQAVSILGPPDPGGLRKLHISA